MLRAAMYSPESNQRMGRLVVGLGSECAMTIAAAMKQMEDEDAEPEPDTYMGPSEKSQYDSTPESGDATVDLTGQFLPPVSTQHTVDRDPELEQEEKLIHAYKMITELQATHQKAAFELEELRQDKEELQRTFDAFRYEVEHESRGPAQSDTIKDFQLKADRDRDYIAELESELEITRTLTSNQERQLERLKSDTDAKQKLRDDLQLLRAERDDLVQKARANENLKKKIQSLQDQEKANASLKEDLRAANEQLQEADRLRDRCASLEKTLKENLQLIANGEQEIFDQKISKNRLANECKVLAQKWEVAKERQGKDHELITELENKLTMLEAGNGTSTGDHGGLEDEMAKSEQSGLEQPKYVTLLPLRSVTIADVSVHRARSFAYDVSSADASILQQKLDLITSRNGKLEADYLLILQDKLGLETAVEDLQDPSREPGENMPFLEQRKQLQSTVSELADLKSQHFSLNAELASVKDRLLNAERGRDLPSLDSGTEYQALCERYDELRSHNEGVDAKLAEQTSLLRHALLNPHALSKESPDIRRANEYKLIVARLEAVRAASEESTVLENVATDLADKIESARSESVATKKVRPRAAKDVSKMSNTKPQRLDEQTAELEKVKKADTSPKTPHKQFASLQRENKLMTSAWYDLSSRLQNNTVMVGRRKEIPKSFLGKQRAIVTPLIAAGQVSRPATMRR